MSIIGALGTAQKAESLSVLDKLSKSSFDGRIKRQISETSDRIKEATKSGKAKAAADKVDQKQLAERVEKLSTELSGVAKELKKLRQQGSKSKAKTKAKAKSKSKK